MADAPASSAVHLAAARRGRHNTLLAWLVPSVLLALMMWLVFNTTQAVEKISLQVMQQGHVIDAINSLRAYMLDVETGERGFIITGQRDFLEPNERGLRKAANFGDTE